MLHVTQSEMLAMRRGSIQSQAFSLIELLVVVAIIGLLAGLTVPAIAAALNRAKIAGSQSNLRQIAMAANLYSTDNNQRFVPHAVFDPELGQNREWSFGYWQMNAENAFKEGILGPYMSEHLNTLTCPVWQARDAQVIQQLQFIGKPALLGYGYNGLNLSRPIPAEQSPGGQEGHYEGYSRATNDSPANTVMFATSAQRFGDAAGPQEMIWGPDHVIKTPCVRLVTEDEALVAWADGSVSMVPAIPIETIDGVTLGELDPDQDGSPDVDIWHR